MLEFTLLFVAFYIWHALGVTVGYHRMLSHRSFACPKLVEYFWVLPGYLAFEGSPIWWATIHRAHHRHVDTELDPHSPRFGLMHAHFGWLLEEKYAPHIDPEKQARDLLKDPIYRFLESEGKWHSAHAKAFSIGIIFRLILWAVFGWQVALCSLLAGGAVLQIPLMLNVFCHIPKLGYRNFYSSDDSVNVWWVALLAMGEGWHNNHHAHPGSARSGLRWWEFDAAFMTICAMKAIGLVTRINDMKERLDAPLPVVATASPAATAAAASVTTAATSAIGASASAAASVIAATTAPSTNATRKLEPAFEMTTAQPMKSEGPVSRLQIAASILAIQEFTAQAEVALLNAKAELPAVAPQLTVLPAPQPVPATVPIHRARHSRYASRAKQYN